jgi:hypothetical protein
MKTFKYILASALVLIGTLSILSLSNSSFEVEPLSKEELKQWTNKGDTILRNEKPVAILDHYEYEYNPNHRNKILLLELCFIQIDDEVDNTIPLLRYSMTIHPEHKVQISFPKMK